MRSPPFARTHRIMALECQELKKGVGAGLGMPLRIIHLQTDSTTPRLERCLPVA